MTIPETSNAAWRKASYSAEQTNCVETAYAQEGALVRDTKAREQGHLDLPSQAWQALIQKM